MDEAAAMAEQQMRMELISEVMTFYDLTSDEWDALPTLVQEKLIRVYDNN